MNLQNAMGRTSQRQGLIANNLANVNTPGYKRQDVDFGIVLDGQDLGTSNFTLARNKTQGGIRTYRGEVRTDGNSVNLESEVAAMAETEIRYQVLVDMTRRHFGGLRDVIREGR